ncbi:MAG: GNAT family N-acetyltransferase [Clostridia bacterium]
MIKETGSTGSVSWAARMLLGELMSFRQAPRSSDREWEITRSHSLWLATGRGDRPFPTLFWPLPGQTGPEDLQALRRSHGAAPVMGGPSDDETAGRWRPLLESDGWAYESFPLMVARAGVLPLAEAVPRALQISPVRDAAAFSVFRNIAVATNGALARLRTAVYGSHGFSADAPIQHWLGWWDGRPVATATVTFFANCPTLWTLGTLAEARGRGIGRAMTLAALQAVVARGHEFMALAATPSGYPVYAHLGFEVVDAIHFFIAPPTEAG